MTRAILLATIAAAVGLGAEDGWTKVQELKSGSEVRILKVGAPQAVRGKIDTATEDSIVLVLKNEQISMPKSNILRLDARPGSGSRITKQTTVKSSHPGNPSPTEQRIGGGAPGPSGSSSTSFSLGSKPDFETIYRRMPASPKP